MSSKPKVEAQIKSCSNKVFQSREKTATPGLIPSQNSGPDEPQRAADASDSESETRWG